MPNQNEPIQEGAGTRAGGDVVTKSASKLPEPDKRAGGDVVTKGASTKPAPEPGKRAGGDVVTKGATKAS